MLIKRSECGGCGQCVAECLENALEIAGHLITVDEVVEDLLKDRVFYETSAGGVTFSGGEPLWQSGFVAQVAKRMRDESIHSALDTAGAVSWCRFQEVLPFIDLVLYDLKLIDCAQHRQYTGGDNDLILANARLLAREKIPMHIRLVMIPGINDYDEDIRARMDFVRELGDSVRRVDILPYHRYGVGKYARLGLDYLLWDIPEYTEDRIIEIRALVESYGLKTTVGG